MEAHVNSPANYFCEECHWLGAETELSVREGLIQCPICVTRSGTRSNGEDVFKTRFFSCSCGYMGRDAEFCSADHLEELGGRYATLADLPDVRCPVCHAVGTGLAVGLREVQAEALRGMAWWARQTFDNMLTEPFRREDEGLD